MISSGIRPDREKGTTRTEPARALATAELKRMTMLPTAMSNRWCRLALMLGAHCLLFVAAPRCEAQNLVPNPSFEEYSACPVTTGFQGFSKPLYWEKWSESPEYFHACAGSLGGVDTLIRVPHNGFGFQYALHGDAYVGMSAYATSGGGVSFREYVGCELLEPLEVGESYVLSFFANVAFGGTYWAPTWACNNMGMLFTNQTNPWNPGIGPHFALRNYAHLHSIAIISDTVNWTLVSGSFVADSAYRYLVIGNHFSNVLTDTLHIIPGNSLAAYYFVDGVCVTRAGQPCEFTVGIAEIGPRAWRAWPNPASDQVQVPVGMGTAWQVFDMRGRMVANGVGTRDVLELGVQDWALGEYVIRLEAQERRHVRFVVLR